MFDRRNTKTTSKSDIIPVNRYPYFLSIRDWGSVRWVCVHLVKCFCQWCRDNAQLRTLDYLGVVLLPTLESTDTSRWFYFWNGTTNANTFDTILCFLCVVSLFQSTIRKIGSVSVSDISMCSFDYLYIQKQTRLESWMM